MRVFAWIMIALVLLSGAVIGYSLWAAALGVGQVQVSVVPANQAVSLYEALRLDGQMDAVKGTVYQDVSSLGDASGYAFHIYDVEVRNRGFLPAEWVEATAAQSGGMILQETEQSPPTIPAFGKATIRTVVLAEQGATPATSLTLTYFVFGRPYSLPLTAELVAGQGADAGALGAEEGISGSAAEDTPQEDPGEGQEAAIPQG